MSMLRRASAALVTVIAVAGLAACGSQSTSSSTTGSSGAGANGPSCTYTPGGSAARPVQAPAAVAAPLPSGSTATIATDRGNVTIALDPDKAPCTVRSFVSLAQQGFFNNTKCHRLTTAQIFVLQCGDPSGTGYEGPGYSFANELVSQDARVANCQNYAGNNICVYPAGTVAMAHSSLPNSNGSQFFLVYKDSPLPYDYTVFGRMDAAGLQVVTGVAAGGLADDQTAPKTPVTITGVQFSGLPSPAKAKKS